MTDKGSTRTFSPTGGTALVTITANPGATTTITSTATIADAPLSSQGTPISGVEGLPLNPAVGGDVLVATFTDQDPAGTISDFSASIDWGDGSTSTATSITSAGSPNGVTFSVFGEHTYQEAGTYPVQVTIDDAGGSETQAHSVANITDAPLSETGTQPTVTMTEGVEATPTIVEFTDANPSATVADYTTGGGAVIVDWGDGTPAVRTVSVTQPAGPGTPFFVSATHTYADSGVTTGTGTYGQYTITVHVDDADGASVNVTNIAHVEDLSIPLAGHLNPASDTGVSNSDAITDNDQPTFVGTTSPFTTVFLFATPTSGGTAVQIGQTEAGSDGSWSITTSALADGSYTITATAVDQSGKTDVTIPPSPVPLLPNATQGPLVVDTVGPQVSKLVFNHLNGQIDITYTDNLSGLNDNSLADAANYSFSKVHKNKQDGHNYLVNVISVSPGGNGNTENVVLTINNGRPIRGGYYNFVIDSASPDFVSGVQDVAGNALDGEFYGYFPSGNHVPGGDFLAQIDAVHNRILPPKTVLGHASPVVPPGTPASGATVTRRNGLSRYRDQDGTDVENAPAKERARTLGQSTHALHDTALHEMDLHPHRRLFRSKKSSRHPV